MARKPTVTSLARDLGVSRQTISNAINNPHRVHPETLERVLDGIRRSGYVTSRAGRQLRTRKADAIGFRLYPTYDGINGNILDRFLHSITLEAEKFGYSIVIFSADNDDREVEHLVAMKNSGAIDAAILAASSVGDARPDELFDKGVPAIVFGRPWGRETSSIPWIDVDGRAGTREVTKLLRDAHHQKIGWIGWSPEHGVGADRRSGYEDAMGDSLDSDLCLLCPDDTAAGRDAAHVLYGRGATAVVCASDTLALGAVSSGLYDISSIVGFDDTPVAQALRLNSVAQPIDDIARHCIKQLLKQVNEEEPIRETLLPATAQIRQKVIKL
ncbi:MAG: LacI family DNA-binding transcriptional regulator [Actinomycetaceae bacterium]|nr:LacI family DNA-binding transcriptional regulator [Actinomycetaceae bacterium]